MITFNDYTTINKNGHYTVMLSNEFIATCETYRECEEEIKEDMNKRNIVDNYKNI